jgi:cytosol alanyl aminopeptidase
LTRGQENATLLQMPDEPLPNPGSLRARRPSFARSFGAPFLFFLAACLGNNDVTRAPTALSTDGASTSAPPPLASGRLPGTAKPLRYDVALSIDPQKDRFFGDVTIGVDVPATTQAIVLHGRDLTIVRAEAIASGQHIPAIATFRRAAGSKEAPEELVLSLSKPLEAGRAEIRISYSAPISDKLSGLYRVKEDNQHYVFTQFEPTDARRMLPCFDEPGYKVPFELRVTTPKGNIAVANSHEVERADVDEGRRTMFRFAPTPPLPTYLFALAAGPLEIRQGATEPVKIRLITTKGKSKLGELVLETASAHTKLLVDYFGRAYPYSKLDLVAVPEFGFGAMENAGLITFREELILLDAKSASTEARRAMATNLAHEISHHWFGNLVTMQWWDDLWLNEGFATWMSGKIVDSWKPGMEARLEQLKAKNVAMGIDALDSARAVRQPVSNTSEAEEAFDGITYDKGAAVLGMLEAWLGPDTFRDGVRSYIKAHDYGSATAADLFQALSKASNKDVWPIASTFLDQPGVPLVRAELVCDKGEAPKVKLAQTRYRARPQADTERKDAAWKIPICIAQDGGGPSCGLIQGPTAEIPLKGRCPKWIYPNAQENGYFRFALPPNQIAALASAGKALDTRSRMGLVTDAWALVQSGDMGSDTLLDLLGGMRQERNRVVVEQMIATLQGVSDKLIDDGARPAFRAYVSSILLPLAREVGWEPRRAESDDQRLLRKSVLTALSTLAEDPSLLGQAERFAGMHLKDPRSVDADIAAIALRASSRRAGDKRFLELQAAARRAPTPQDRVVSVGALGAFADPQLLRRALDLMLTGEIKMQDSFYIYNAAMTYPESRATVLAWVKEHFAELKGKVPDFVLTRLAGSVESVCDSAARADAAKFFVSALKGTEAGDRTIQQALERADLCIHLRGREATRIKKKLNKKG